MSWAIMSAVSGLFMGLMLVASNPSPYFAVLGLVASALMSCNLLAHEGGTFLALVLLLIYLGGMLIALGFSSSMVHDPYPLTPTDLKVFCLYGFYVILTFLAWAIHAWVVVEKGYSIPAEMIPVFGHARGDSEGVALLYSSGAMALVVSAGVLLLTLFVVLELTRGLSRGALRTP